MKASGAMGAMGKMSGRGWDIRGSGRLGGLISSYRGKEHLKMEEVDGVSAEKGGVWCICAPSGAP